MGKFVLSEIDERGIAKLTLNRPEIHNAFNDEMIAEITGLFQEYDKDENVKVVFDESLADLDKVFCGSGKKGATIEIHVQDLITASQATVFPVARSDTE